MQLDKVAIITGASRGIGKSIALGLAKDGYNVVLIARTESKLLELQNEIKNFGVKSKIICTDITHSDVITKALNDVTAEWCRVDVLINNAGIFRVGSLAASLEDYQALFDVNVKAQLVLMKAIIPVMQKQKNGLIVNIAATVGKVGCANLGAYTSSKFALVGLSESLYNEYSAQGIKITSICPGDVATETKESRTPKTEMIQPDDILQTIRWLLLLSQSAFVKEVVINTWP